MAVSNKFSLDGIHNLGAHRASFIPQSVRSYTKRMSLSPLGTQKKLLRLRKVSLVMYCLFHTFLILFLTTSHSNFSTGISNLLVNRGSFTFTNISHSSLHSCLMSFVHLQNSRLDPSYQPQNEDLPTQIRASKPAARSLSLYDSFSSLSFTNGRLCINFI